MLPSITCVVDRACNDYRWYYALDQQNPVFVGRMKSNACYTVIETRPARSNGINLTRRRSLLALLHPAPGKPQSPPDNPDQLSMALSDA